MNKTDKEQITSCLIDLEEIENTLNQEITCLLNEIVKGGKKIPLKERMFKLTEAQARIKIIIERLKGE